MKSRESLSTTIFAPSFSNTLQQKLAKQWWESLSPFIALRGIIINKLFYLVLDESRDTIWRRKIQDMLTWRRHADAFAQPQDTRLPNDDEDNQSKLSGTSQNLITKIYTTEPRYTSSHYNHFVLVRWGQCCSAPNYFQTEQYTGIFSVLCGNHFNKFIPFKSKQLKLF